MSDDLNSLRDSSPYFFIKDEKEQKLFKTIHKSKNNKRRMNTANWTTTKVKTKDLKTSLRWKDEKDSFYHLLLFYV